MDDTVMATPEGRAAIQSMKQIIEGTVLQGIQSLNSQGQKLSDPRVWSGPLARQFRSAEWPEMNKRLQAIHQELEQLRGRVQQIQENIMRAGGSG